MITTSTVSPDRQTFRVTVAQVAEKARAILPQAVNGRVESAVKLVLQGDVELLEDGSIQVGSSDPTRYYRLTGQACTCTDFTQGKAPEGWCKHRIAAGIDKRVRELVPTPAPEPPPPAAALPEAPASCNVYVTISGHRVQVTLRDTDEQRMLERLQTLLDRYPAPASPPVSNQGPDAAPQCPTHGAMKPSTKRKGWYCPHKSADGSWCQSKGK